MTGTPPDLWLLLASGITLLGLGRRRTPRRPTAADVPAATPATERTSTGRVQQSA